MDSKNRSRPEGNSRHFLHRPNRCRRRHRRQCRVGRRSRRLRQRPRTDRSGCGAPRRRGHSMPRVDTIPSPKGRKNSAAILVWRVQMRRLRAHGDRYPQRLKRHLRATTCFVDKAGLSEETATLPLNRDSAPLQVARRTRYPRRCGARSPGLHFNVPLTVATDVGAIARVRVEVSSAIAGRLGPITKDLPCKPSATSLDELADGVDHVRRSCVAALGNPLWADCCAASRCERFVTWARLSEWFSRS